LISFTVISTDAVESSASSYGTVFVSPPRRRPARLDLVDEPAGAELDNGVALRLAGR
jgi:hypothetical protein